MPNNYIDRNVSGETFWRSIVVHKFSKPIVLIFVLAMSLACSFLIARGGVLNALFIIIALIGIPAVYATVVYPQFGIIVLMGSAFFINYVSRVIPEDTPIGLIMDGLTYLLILGFFIKIQKEGKQWGYYFNNIISYFIIAWLAYNLLEVFNPVADSKLAWLYTVRTVGFLMLMYFVFAFQLRTKEFIKLLFKFWLFFALLGGISAFQQENFGFFDWEKQWLNSDPLRVSLLFINGHMRKFGIFSDPVVFSYNMVAASLICISFILSDIKTHKKVLLSILIVFFVTVMLYSGTRASFVLIPVGAFLLGVLKYNKKMLIWVAFIAVLLYGLVNMPTKNGTLYRFQSAFKPSKDASFNVRVENQRRIKPYILTHPIGGGLGSVGVWGERFSPHSYLSKFPPDSGYVRVAVEMGWLGLILYCVLNFVILYKGIYYYYVIKDPELKKFCLAMVLVVFVFDCGNYLQQAIVQYPSNILFYIAIAIINVTMRLDLEQQKQQAVKLVPKLAY